MNSLPLHTYDIHLSLSPFVFSSSNQHDNLYRTINITQIDVIFGPSRQYGLLTWAYFISVDKYHTETTFNHIHLNITFRFLFLVPLLFFILVFLLLYLLIVIVLPELLFNVIILLQLIIYTLKLLPPIKLLFSYRELQLLFTITLTCKLITIIIMIIMIIIVHSIHGHLLLVLLGCPHG